MKIKSTTIKLDDNLHTRVKDLAEVKQRTSHWLMREAIAQYVDREENRARLYAEAKQAWEDYQETGRFVEGSSALAWLDSWGTEEEQPIPVCQSAL